MGMVASDLTAEARLLYLRRRKKRLQFFFTSSSDFTKDEDYFAANHVTLQPPGENTPVPFVCPTFHTVSTPELTVRAEVSLFKLNL